MDFNFDKGELILINKPVGWTSFDVVNKIRYLTKTKKVGHAGTLDPLATGLLIICTGTLTKKISLFQNLDKTYTGTMHFGAITPSYDTETKISETFETSHLRKELIIEKAKIFYGSMSQNPPPYSAVNIKGERAYKKARRGEKFIIKSRIVTIKSFEINKIELPKVDFKVKCTSGTYIRSLVHDFGKSLQSGCYLENLCRISIGDYQLENAFDLNSFVNLVS